MISVIVPARNEEKYIGHLIESLQNQTMKPNEIIVVSFSEDKTNFYAAKLGAKVIPVTRRGIAYARNLGAKISKGDLLMFSDADNKFYPHAIERMHKEIEKGKLLVHSNFNIYNHSRFHDFINAFANILKPLWWTSRCVMVRRDAFFRIGGYNEEYEQRKVKENPKQAIGEDREFGSRFYDVFGPENIAWIPEPLFEHSSRKWVKIGVWPPSGIEVR